MRRLHGLVLVALVGSANIALCLAPRSARAQEKSPRQRAKEHTQQGQKYQQLGEFEKAIAEYQAAYELVPHPQLLYNLGQAHRLNGDMKQALANYETFVSIESDTAAARKALGFIALLKEAIAADADRRDAEPPIDDSDVDEPGIGDPASPGPDPALEAPVADPQEPDPMAPVPPLPAQALGSLQRGGMGGGAAFSFVDYKFGSGVGPSFQLGYELIFSGLGVRPGVRVDYFLLDDNGDGENSFLHIGSEVRVRKLLFERLIPFAGLGLGLTRFVDNFVDGSEEAFHSLGVHVDAGLEIRVYERFAIGAMYLGSFGEDSIQGGGFTLTRY